MACVFLAALDEVCPSFPSCISSHLVTYTSKTIVATALPTIVSKLGGGSRYSWVGRFVPSIPIRKSVDQSHWVITHISLLSAYLLAAARCVFNFTFSFNKSYHFFSLSPLYGKLSDLIGRKPILYSSIVIFLVRRHFDINWAKLSRLLCLKKVGSALSGAAQNMVQQWHSFLYILILINVMFQSWLIAARAVQGVGGGGILQMVLSFLCYRLVSSDLPRLGRHYNRWHSFFGRVSRQADCMQF